MTKTVKKIIIGLIIMTLLAVGYMLSFVTIYMGNSGIQSLIFVLVFTLFYLSCWLFVLFLACKKCSKVMLSLYFIFWSVSAVAFVFSPFVQFSSYLPALIAMLIILIPISGFDSLVFYISHGFVGIDNIYASLMVSIIMLVLGLIVIKRRRNIQQ